MKMKKILLVRAVSVMSACLLAVLGEVLKVCDLPSGVYLTLAGFIFLLVLAVMVSAATCVCLRISAAVIITAIFCESLFWCTVFTAVLAVCGRFSFFIPDPDAIAAFASAASASGSSPDPAVTAGTSPVPPEGFPMIFNGSGVLKMLLLSQALALTGYILGGTILYLRSSIREAAGKIRQAAAERNRAEAEMIIAARRAEMKAGTEMKRSRRSEHHQEGQGEA